MNKKLGIKILSIILPFVIWQVLAMIVGSDMLLASPIKVVTTLAELVVTGIFWLTILHSMLRIAAGFLIALILGFIFAILAGRFKTIEVLLKPYIVTIKSVPVASFIILCLIWFSFKGLTIIISVLIAFPVIYQNVLSGIKSTDVKMLEMANAYHLSYSKRFKYIILPSIKPFIISAGSISVGMTWKAGIAAEVIGVVGGSIGARLYDAKIYFINSELMAWTLVIVFLSILMEKIVTGLIKCAFVAIER